MPLKQGYLGGKSLQAGQEATIYQCEAPAIAATFTVSFCNTGAAEAVVHLSHGPGADSSAAGTLFLEKNWKVKPGKTEERTGLALSAGRNLFALTDGTVDVIVHGFEKG